MILQKESSRGPVVLVYPGLGANKEMQRKEAEWLVQSGLRSVCIDSPHHGERADGTLEKLASLSGGEAHAFAIELVREAISEIPAIVNWCEQSLGISRLAITGISLGAYIAFGAVLADPRIHVSVPILGSPDWSPGFPGKENPIHSPEGFQHCAVLAINAGKDIFVPPAPARSFINELRNTFPREIDRFQYVEYPDSEHMMREQDWYDTWRRAIEWIHRFLR